MMLMRSAVQITHCDMISDLNWYTEEDVIQRLVRNY